MWIGVCSGAVAAASVSAAISSRLSKASKFEIEVGVLLVLRLLLATGDMVLSQGADRNRARNGHGRDGTRSGRPVTPVGKKSR